MEPLTAATASRVRRVLLLATLLAACRDGASIPRDHAARLLIPGTEDAAAVLVDVDRRGIVGRFGPPLARQGPLVPTTDRLWVTGGRLPGDESILLALDVSTGREAWRITVAQGTVPVPVDGVELGIDAIASHPTRPEVFLWPAEQGGARGIAALDLTTRRVVGFVDRVPANRVRALAAVRSDSAHPDPCLVVAADGFVGQQLRAYLLFFCGADLSRRDSMPLSPPTGFVTQLERSPLGSDLVLASNTEVLVIDPALRQVRWRAVRPLEAGFFTSEADGRVFLADSGTSTLPSSGIIYALDSTLELSAIFDLRSLPRSERTTSIYGGAVSPDGRWVYVIGGVRLDDPAWDPQETRVMLIEASTGAVGEYLRLGTYGGGRPLVIP